MKKVLLVFSSEHVLGAVNLIISGSNPVLQTPSHTNYDIAITAVQDVKEAEKVFFEAPQDAKEGHNYDLVFLDIDNPPDMPHKSYSGRAVDFFKMIRKDKTYSDVNLVVLSEDQEKLSTVVGSCPDSGSTYLLEKPFSPQKLVDYAELLLGIKYEEN